MASRKRGPKGPTIDDRENLRAMVPLVLKRWSDRAAARKIVCGGNEPNNAESATIERLRRKFRAGREELIAEHQSRSRVLQARRVGHVGPSTLAGQIHEAKPNERLQRLMNEADRLIEADPLMSQADKERLRETLSHDYTISTMTRLILSHFR